METIKTADDRVFTTIIDNIFVWINEGFKMAVSLTTEERARIA